MFGVLYECGEGNGNFFGFVKGGEIVLVSVMVWFCYFVMMGIDVMLGIENNRLFFYLICYILYVKDFQFWDGLRGLR